jgi:hypothetical protein
MVTERAVCHQAASAPASKNAHITRLGDAMIETEAL